MNFLCFLWFFLPLPGMMMSFESFFSSLQWCGGYRFYFQPCTGYRLFSVYIPNSKLFLMKSKVFTSFWTRKEIWYLLLYLCHYDCLQMQKILNSSLTMNSSFFQINEFIYSWLRWVFVAACGFSLVAASGGYSSLRCVGFSLQWLLLLQSMGSRWVGFSSFGAQAQ